MNIRTAVIIGLSVLVSSFVGCVFGLQSWGRSMDDFVIEEGGMILCNPPGGYREIDLDAGVERDIFDKPGQGGKPYRAGWRKDRVWRSVRSDSQTIEAISPFAGVVERHTISKFKGVNTRWITVYGPVSREIVLLKFGTGVSEEENIFHVCLFNTFTGEIQEIWKYKGPYGSPVWVSDQGSLILEIEGEKGETLGVFDRKKNKWVYLTRSLQKPKATNEGSSFSVAGFSPATGLFLIREFYRYQDEKGFWSSWTRTWLYDPKTGKMEKVSLGKKIFTLFYGSKFAPDGMRVILESHEEGFIYDLSTGIIAPLPDTKGFRLSAGWSPSGRYIAYYCYTRLSFVGQIPINDVYVADAVTGQNKRVRDSSRDNRGRQPITWLAPPATKREVNINYVKWLVSLLDRGVEKEKVRKRLQEFTSQKTAIKDEEWKKWLEENADYLAWSEKEKRLYLCAEAKEAGIHMDVWETIPEDKRAAWAKLSEEERANLRKKAEAEFAAGKKLEKAAWYAGVDSEVWVQIPREKQKNWKELKAEERIELVAAAKKKYVEQKSDPPAPSK